MNFKLILIGLLLVLFSTPIFALSDANLVAYYNFDETSGTTLIDVKGYDQNGVNTNATINQTGKINKAYTFNGTTSHIHSLPLITNNSPFTITAWIYPTVTSGVHIIYNSRSSTVERPVLSLELNGNEVSFVLRDNSDMVPGLRINSTSITPNNWYFVTATYSGADKNGSLYLNGVLQGTAINSDNGWSGINRTYIGAGAWDSSQQFNGLIDEIGIFDKNLSQTEINELYNSGNGLTYPFDINQIYADFDYSINNLQVDLNDTSRVDGNAVIDSWEWLIDDVSVSTDQNYSFTGTEYTDYNICLLIEDTVLSLNDSICQTVSIGDITPPTTTFSSNQVPNTTDQNITLTCTDNNSGCKAINYNVDSLGWNTITRVDNCDDCNVYYGTGGYEIPYSDTTNVKVDHTWSFGFNTFNSSANQQIISQNTSSQFHIQSFHLDAGKLYYKIYANPTSYVDIEITTIDSNTPYYVVASIDFSGTSKIYVNNVEKWSQSLGTFAYGGTVGNYNTLIASTLNGIIYDVNITNTALNASQAETMYNYLSRPRRINSPINFLYSGAGDHNIQYFSTDNADNNETIKTSNFTTYGKGRFYFKDENSGSDLTGVQVNFNGTDYDSGANNYIDFNFQTLSSTNTTYLFTLTKTGYSTRYYQTDLNYFGDFNTTFALLPESLATDLQFKMFPPTGSSVLANTYIEFKDKDTNWTITKLKSNADGELTANLKSDDQNYLVWISEGTYIYQAVQLTILYPKDEQTLTDITGNWRIEITDNISYQDLNIPQGTSKIIYLLPNTKYPFTIAVQDVAGTYFKRRWSKLYTGNPLTDTLQPYLLSADDGIAVKFVFQDPKRDSIQNIIVNIYKNIGGVKTLISNGASDVTGNALFFLIAGDKYWLDFTYNGAVIFETQNYSVTSSVVYWTLNLVTGEIQGVDGSFINLVWNPVTDFISKEATSIGYKVNGSKINFTTIDLYTLNGTDKNIFYSTGGVCNTSCTTTILKTNIPYTTGTIYADVNVYTDTNAYMFTYTKKWIIGTTSNIDTQNLFINARLDFGCSTDPLLPCPLTTILSVVLMIILLGGMVFSFNFVNPKGLLIAGLGILAVFTYLGWFWWVALVLMIITSIFYLRSEN